jgi:short subunit dehydrogenase-like uncharacterized protein
MVYGANGYTGELIAREAVERGMQPILAARNGRKVAEVATALGLEHRQVTLDDPSLLREELENVAAVLHCAGPFVHTSKPMVEACLASATHYLDITGEIAVFETVLSLGEQAENAGVVLLPGVGFDVVPTDCLAARLAESLPEARQLELAFHTEGGAWSRGTLKTVIEGMPHSGAIRREGRIVRVPIAWKAREIEFSCGQRWAMTIPWGDVSTAFHTTGIPNIRVYGGASPGRIARARRMRLLLPLMGARPVKRLAQWWVDRTVTGPDEAERSEARTYLWGRVRDRADESVTGTLETAEGYSFTATAAVQSVDRVLEGRVAPGAWTPARAFGSRFVEELPGVGPITLQRG